MHFGLTNVTAMFQDLMNDILGFFLRRFVLVFFYDIPIYNLTWHEHLRHVRMVLQELRRRQLALKQSKCIFGAESMAYLGHMIFAAGIEMDKQKVAAVAKQLVLQSVRVVRAFLGLAEYYRRFIKDYGAIMMPLTRLPQGVLLLDRRGRGCLGDGTGSSTS